MIPLVYDGAEAPDREHTTLRGEVAERRKGLVAEQIEVRGEHQPVRIEIPARMGEVDRDVRVVQRSVPVEHERD
jgi:hypothetical protein